MASPLIVVGWLYNSNGMATWCIETARTLKKLRFEVCLVASALHLVPQDLQCNVLIFTLPPADQRLTTRLRRKCLALIEPLLPVRGIPHFTLFISQELEATGRRVGLFLLNQSNLVNDRCNIPQLVVAWAWPITLGGYLGKLFLPTQQNIWANLRQLLYWYRMDNTGYRSATAVLAVHPKLVEALQHLNITVELLYPGLAAELNAEKTITDTSVFNILITSANIEDPRKNNRWLIECLSGIQTKLPWKLTLVGQVSESFSLWASEKIPCIEITGLLPRDEALKKFASANLLLFGSALDDWGYVQIEAMSRGLMLMAPDQLPSNVIIESQAFLYAPGNRASLIEKLEAVISQTHLWSVWQKSFAHRYASLFSLEAYGNRLDDLIKAYALK